MPRNVPLGTTCLSNGEIFMRLLLKAVHPQEMGLFGLARLAAQCLHGTNVHDEHYALTAKWSPDQFVPHRRDFDSRRDDKSLEAWRAIVGQSITQGYNKALIQNIHKL